MLLFAIGIYKIPSVDVPWHLATGRWALEHGHFPTVNTFSWTWPDHPLHQQYPLFQLPLALLVEHLGWSAVSLANASMWTLAVLVWIHWGGSLRSMMSQPLLWLLVVLGVQRHHVPRPEVLTLLGLGLLLLAIDALRQRSGKSLWGPIAGIALAQWMMVNGHQMWPLGIALQLSFLLHLVLVKRLGGRALGPVTIDSADCALPLWPAMVALGLSLVAAMLSPLGAEVYLAPLTTLDTLLSQGQATATGAQAKELEPVWSDPLATTIIALLTVHLLAWLVAARRTIVLFDLAVSLMGLVLIGAAIRGMPFAAVAFGSVAARCRQRSGPLLPPESLVHGAAALVTVILSLSLGRVILWSEPVYYQLQRGLGRSVGEWGDGVSTFLNRSPPPGELFNLGWVVGNPLIGSVYPRKRVFVDPRWEAYPRPFLLEAIAAQGDKDVLAALIARYHPGAVVAEMRRIDVQTRVSELWSTGQWPLVYADSEHVVLLDAAAPEAAAWLVEHPPIRPSQLVASLDAHWVTESPLLLAQQQIRVARLLLFLGESADARVLLDAARARAAHPIVDSELREVELLFP